MLGMLPWRLDHITTAVTAACDMVRAVGGSDCAAVYRRLYFPATITVTAGKWAIPSHPLGNGVKAVTATI